MSAIRTVKISQIKPNPKNPRVIKDDKFNKLLQSIKDFPQMLEKRPLVCFTDKDKKLVVLGGNMRLKAAQEIGLKELPVMLADDWTEDQKNKFLIKDNVNFGEWDWDELANEWDSDQLTEWGLEIPNFQNNYDFSDKNKEIDIDDLDSEMVIKLKYPEAEYNQVKGQLLKIASTPEQAIWKLLGNE
jgi:ParB-like chromosome segregation protein Spo0J